MALDLWGNHDLWELGSSLAASSSNLLPEGRVLDVLRGKRGEGSAESKVPDYISRCFSKKLKPRKGKERKSLGKVRWDGDS